MVVGLCVEHVSSDSRMECEIQSPPRGNIGEEGGRKGLGREVGEVESRRWKEKAEGGILWELSQRLGIMWSPTLDRRVRTSWLYVGREVFRVRELERGMKWRVRDRKWRRAGIENGEE